MVRALIEGRKTQTRRILKPQPNMLNGGKPLNDGRGSYSIEGGWKKYPIEAGDRLWVKERCAMVPTTAYRMSEGVQQTIDPSDPDNAAIYLAGWDRTLSIRFRSSIHMPRWASRITLLVYDVKVERLMDISEEDAIAEGAYPCENGWTYGGVPLAGSTARGAYYCLWNSINGRDAWDLNPWVVAYTFRRIMGNIDHDRR